MHSPAATAIPHTSLSNYEKSDLKMTEQRRNGTDEIKCRILTCSRIHFGVGFSLWATKREGSALHNWLLLPPLPTFCSEQEQGDACRQAYPDAPALGTVKLLPAAAHIPSFE